MGSTKMALMNLYAGQEYRPKGREWFLDTSGQGQGGENQE